MSEKDLKNKQENDAKQEELDSLGIPVKRSPWFWFAILQIPIVLIMISIVAYLAAR